MGSGFAASPRPGMTTSTLIWEEFAAEGELDPVALGIGLVFDRHVEIDRTHDRAHARKP
jgi:hypothetical protein